MNALLEELDRRYVLDPAGRIVASRGEGVLPRFVLGRSLEGCVWRFRADLEGDLIVRVARLAAREPGIPIGVEGPSLAPERLVMIERLFAGIGFENAGTGGDALPVEARRSTVTRDGVVVAELFTID